MSDDFCIIHGYDHMRSQMGNPIPYCQACDGAPDVPVAEMMLLQARKADGGNWINIFPAQLQWMAKEGYDVRALDADDLNQQLKPTERA